jgi:hypothetical protein
MIFILFVLLLPFLGHLKSGFTLTCVYSTCVFIISGQDKWSVCYAQSYFPLNIHIELSPPLSSHIHTDRTFIGQNMTQCAAHVCIVIIRISKRSVLKRICVQGCICRSILILFLQLNLRKYNFPKLILFWQLNLVKFIQNNSYCNNLTL